MSWLICIIFSCRQEEEGNHSYSDINMQGHSNEFEIQVPMETSPASGVQENPEKLCENWWFLAHFPTV